MLNRKVTKPTPSPAGNQSNDPSPVGIIRLIGPVDSKVDVNIQSKGGKFSARGRGRKNDRVRLLWRDLAVSQKSDAMLSGVGPDHWFTSLRKSDSDYLTGDRSGTEKFLLYDLQMPYPSPIKVKESADFSLEFGNISNAALHQLTFYQGGEHDSIRTLAVGDVVPSLPATRPTTSPSTQATTRPAVRLVIAPTTQPADLLVAWKPVIDAAGVDASDADVIERVILKYAFDPQRLTAVYRMDDAELDRLLPLDIVPQPAKIKRFALVIVINADPSGGTEIDDLIKQLGDEDWSRRDAAYHTLAGMGPAATEKLTAASKNSDLEIAWRAERLLALSGQSAK